MIPLPFFKRNQPVVRKREAHTVSRALIDPDALRVLYRLADSGHIAYLVGGSVRDLLLGRTPKDFDIGTDARPNDIRRLFRNCFLIGRRFRLAHIVFGRKIIETSTFRRQPDESDDGLYQTEDNTFGSPEEDAKRRDFTVNGLFYDIKTFSIIDYVGGLKDLEKRVLRCIGDPNVRFREDPVRMMRAVKFAARLDFTIDRASTKAIAKHHADILKASVPRVCEEVFRLFTYARSRAAFQLLWRLHLLRDLLPEVDAFVHETGGERSTLWTFLDALDASPHHDDFSNGARLACLYYPLFLAQLRREESRAAHGRVNRQHVAHDVLTPVAQRLHIPKASLYAAAALMDVGRRFTEPPKRGRLGRFVRHEFFPEALAFHRVLLAAGVGSAALLDEWQAFYDQEAALAPVPAEPHDGPRDDGFPDPAEEPRDAEPLEPSRRRRRRRRPRRGEADQPGITVSEERPGAAPDTAPA